MRCVWEEEVRCVGEEEVRCVWEEEVRCVGVEEVRCVWEEEVRCGRRKRGESGYVGEMFACVELQITLCMLRIM